MAELSFSDISFLDDKSQPYVKITFLKLFETILEKPTLEKIGKYRLKSNSIEFINISEKSAQNKFYPLLTRSFLGMTNKISGRRAVYVHQNSGIPLIGSIYFGIVDRGTNIIELKPITSCNINCIFCSVDEGNTSRKTADFVVEDQYLISETQKLVDHKQENGKEVLIDIFINTHGEPLLYSNMVALVSGLSQIEHVRTISIITNATLLTKKLADELIASGLNQINISINAIDADIAKKLAGTQAYNIKQVLDITRYVAGKIKTVVAPVWIKSVNDSEIPKLISFAKEINAELGIQNYMQHKLGKKISEELDWPEFYQQLDKWESEFSCSLKTVSHTMYKTKPLEKPFAKGDVISAEIVCPGRSKNEAISVAKGRSISVLGCLKESGRVKVRIIKDKDNIFVAEIA